MAQKTKSKQRSDNPNNPTCSSIMQAFLDAKEAGYPTELIDAFLEYSNDHKDKLDKADKIHKEHQYPDDRLSFYQGNRDIQKNGFLTVYEIAILELMIPNMGTNNLIALSIADIKDYAGLADKTATKALNGLKDKGCIAVKFNRNKAHGVIFMVNPALAVVGNVNKTALQYAFWCLTGSEYIDGVWNRSKPHEKWLILTKDQKYSRNHSSHEYPKNQFTKFVALNEPINEKDLPAPTDKPNDDNA